MKRIGEQIVHLKQQAAWSDMPTQYAKVLEFIKDNVLVVIVCTDRILKQCSVRMPIHPLFKRAASAVLELENQNR